MRAYLAFTRKEFLESLRTYKLLIMIMAFMFFGMLAPLTAKMIPKLLESMNTGGMQINIGEISALNSWEQFFKTIPQMGIIVVAIIFSGMMANEFNRGTFINILTKGLPRRTIILSKFTVSSMIWTLSYFVSFVLCYLYTAHFWSGDGILNLVPSMLCLWLFGILLLAVILLGGVIFKSSYGCLMFVGAFLATLSLLNIIPKFQEYNPVALKSKNILLLTGDIVPKDLMAPIIISIVIVILSIFATIKIFNKKQI